MPVDPEQTMATVESPRLTEFLDVPRLCAWLGVTKTWVHDNVENGNLPYVRVSTRRLIFDVALMNEWIDRRRGNQGAEASNTVPTPRPAESAGECILPPHMA